MANANEIDKLQKASLIHNEIKKGESDEKSIKSRTRKNNNSSLYDKKNLGGDKKIVNTKKEEICREKLYAREAARAPKTIRVPVYTKQRTPIKQNYNLRNCMTREEWMTSISKPNRKCSPNLKEKILKATPTRINELAQPPRQRMIATLYDRGTILPAPLVDRLITVLEAESCLTPEQAEKLFRAKRKKKKRKGKKRKTDKKSEEPMSANHQFQFDKDSAICQYLMAETFVKSILQWECTIPKEDFQDIAEVIFGRLKKLFHHNAVDDDERGGQQMRLLADIIAAWIAGILFEVARFKEDDLKKKCEERKKTVDENIEDDDSMIDAQTISDEDSIKRDDDDDDDDDDDGDDDDDDDDDSDDENNNNDNDVSNDDDDNDSEDRDGNHPNRSIVVDNVEDKKDENEFHKIKKKENNDEQTHGKEALNALIDYTGNEKMKTGDKIENEVIKEYAFTHVSREIASTINERTNRHSWQQYMGAKPFKMGLYENFINQNGGSLTILDEHHMIKNDGANYPQDSIAPREINPNL